MFVCVYIYIYIYILYIYIYIYIHTHTHTHTHTICRQNSKLNGSKYCYVLLIIQLNISHLSTQFNDCTVLFVCTQFKCQTIDKTKSGAITLGQNEPGSNVNEGVLYIPQSSSITGASPSDLMLGVGVLLLGVFYSIADWVENFRFDYKPSLY